MEVIIYSLLYAIWSKFGGLDGGAVYYQSSAKDEEEEATLMNNSNRNFWVRRRLRSSPLVAVHILGC